MTSPTSRTVRLGQFRISRLQVINWGTFCGYKNFSIDDRGVLFTGPSGSGKSSLMDAHSLALLPTYDQRFNASADLTARGSKQGTRSVADYVRGAWSETNDENEKSTVRYLRGGQPTWSAIAATYDNGLGAVTTAVVVKWFTGVETDVASLHTMHQLHDGHFELETLNTWAERTFDTRWWKSTHPAEYPTSQSAYMDELAKRIGLGRSRTALSLLGKAKAMKNVGDLNLFIRDNMLDRPDTYDAAEKMLAAFTPLNEAYNTASRAYAQEQVLRDVPESWATYKESEHTRTLASALRGTPLDHYMRGLHLTVLQEELDRIDDTIKGLDEQVGEREILSDAAQAEYKSLDAQLTQENRALQELQLRLDTAHANANAAEDNYRLYSGHVTRVGQPCPQDETAFTELRDRIPTMLAADRQHVEDLTPAVNEAIGKQIAARNTHRDKADELIRLQSAKTLIPGPAVTRREQIAHGAGVPVADLPYAAELIDIAEGQERWRPAAEKVLRNYGMRLLVSEHHKHAVREFIDTRNMGGIVEYSIVTATSTHQPRPLPNTLAGKLTVDTEHPNGPWLIGQLAQQFNHVCVQSAGELEDHRIAVTVRGTVKRPGNHYRKDDRPELTNPASYILGANTAAKRRALEGEVAALEEEKASATRAAAELSEQRDMVKNRITAAEHAAEYTAWSALDYWTTTRIVRDLEERIEEIRAGNVDLLRLEARRDAAEEKWEKAIAALQRTRELITETSQRQTRLVGLYDQELIKPHTIDDDNDRTYLAEVYASINTTATVATIGHVRSLLDSALKEQASSALHARDVAYEKVKNAISRFLEKWSDTAPDTSGDVERSGEDFATLHSEIVQRRLPEAMGRFQKMISEDMVPSIAVLQHGIETAASEIVKRIRMVNAGLRRVEFNAGTHLQIAYTANTAADAKEFRSSVDTLMRNAAGIKNDPQKSVAQFKRVRELMAKFTATGTAAERWKKNVLDVRTGYTFYGREVDTEQVTVHTYRNTAANSGGEQEKLVAFCLAAALSYNLADPDSEGRPRFGTLMLDEAFSKSDETFSAQALSAFDEFGFQLLIAAPIRMSGIVEPYIGQAILVEKRITSDGARSNAKSATFGELADRRFAEADGDARASA